MPQQPNPRPNLRSSLTSLLPPFPLATALISLAAGLITALLWQTIHTPLKLCYAQWPQATTLQNAQKHQQEFNTLNAQKQNLLKQIQAHKQQCALPTWKPDSLQKPLNPLKKETENALPPPDFSPLPELRPLQGTIPPKITTKRESVPTPPPAKQSQATSLPPSHSKPLGDLPEETWNKHDPSMLKGCWQLSTHMNILEIDGDFRKTYPITQWTLCFDASGNGRQTLTMSDGRQCRGGLHVHFNGQAMMIEESSPCEGDFPLLHGRNACVRLNNQAARCTYIDSRNERPQGIFRRR
ncbi:hypothetical protein [Entomobacter blattae]|uniref:Uncharacterized protein n=1 Tax=Entomobacter blattae TaxID=2762277 RepID=A0A7H1NQD0_9PROT|nr:hypothetical protein [Entomobacter blattae]QNT77990.1 hypothetical protein JGUZn3_07550 [Entomobacter blattae]